MLDRSQECSIDPGESTSGLETDAGAVNGAILSGIRRLNESIASLGGYHGAHADFQDDLESEDVSYVSIQNDLNNIANSGPAAVTERESDTDVLLDYCCQLDVETNAKAPKINEKVADVVNKLCVKRVSQDQSKEIMKRHNTPENVMVRLPKCEQSIWN